MKTRPAEMCRVRFELGFKESETTMPASKEEVVIVVVGPSGYTAAIYAARAGRNPLLLTEPHPGSHE